MQIVRAFQPHEWPLYRDLRLAALRDAPDAFGSTLAREEGIPEPEWSARLAAGAASPLDQPLVAKDAGRPVGLAWVRIAANDLSTATIYQVWIHPEARRRGIGRLMLDTAIAWARDAGASAMELSVACGPESAIEFYRRAGFVEVGRPDLLRPDSHLLQQSMRRAL